MTPAAVSIALVTKNGARTLPALLDAIARQRIAGRVEVVAVDSGSADESLALLRDRVDRFISIPPAAFNHGLTRLLKGVPYPWDEEILSALRRELTLTHFKRLIYLEDPLKRDFYAEMCRAERWNTRTLAKKIRGMLFVRIGAYVNH